MPIAPSLAQSEASRLNGTLSTGPTSAAGKARSALNSVRHGLTGRSFFLLPDEDPEEFRAHEALWLDQWRPRDAAERDMAELAIRALWREIRADRLEARILADLFAADAIAEEPERRAAKVLAMRALATLLRYRAPDHPRARRGDAQPGGTAPPPTRPAAGAAGRARARQRHRRARRTRACVQPAPAAGARRDPAQAGGVRVAPSRAGQGHIVEHDMI